MEGYQAKHGKQNYSSYEVDGFFIDKFLEMYSSSSSSYTQGDPYK